MFVPTAFGTSSLVKIETAFGSAAPTVETTFKLWSVDSAGNTYEHASWTHAANTRHKIITTGISNAGLLDGRTVYIECTGGGTGAAGYTASLQWQI